MPPDELVASRHALLEFIQTRYPQIRLRLVPTYAEARQLVLATSLLATSLFLALRLLLASASLVSLSLLPCDTIPSIVTQGLHTMPRRDLGLARA